MKALLISGSLTWGAAFWLMIDAMMTLAGAFNPDGTVITGADSGRAVYAFLYLFEVNEHCPYDLLPHTAYELLTIAAAMMALAMLLFLGALYVWYSRKRSVTP